MRLITVLLFLGFAFGLQAQEVNFNGNTYKIKGKKILLEGTDVTTELSAENKTEIWTAFNKQEAVEKAQKEAEKAQKKAERAQKKAEKAQKKAEKELKAKQKAQSKFENAQKNYKKSVAKYERLKNRGKLSPNNEAKWLKKLDGLKEDIEKAKRNL